MFDLTRKLTFDHITTWLSDLRTHADPNIAVVLVGNKADLVDSRQVSTQEAEAWADANGVIFVEASAKTGDNVESAFEKVAKKVYGNIKDGVFDLNDRSNGIKIRQAKSGIIPAFDGKKGGSCC